MTRDLIVLNIMNNYGKYGIAEETITQLIDSGLKDGLNYDAIYLGLSMAMESIYEKPDEKQYYSAEDVAKALCASVEEVEKAVDEGIEELKAAGENPDDYFKRVPVSEWMM